MEVETKDLFWEGILEIFPIECDETYSTVGHVVIWLESREKLHAGAFPSYKAAQRYIRSNWHTIHETWMERAESAMGFNGGT